MIDLSKRLLVSVAGLEPMPWHMCITHALPVHPSSCVCVQSSTSSLPPASPALRPARAAMRCRPPPSCRPPPRCRPPCSPPPHCRTRPHTFSIGHAPTSRARCRGCKCVVGKGEARLVTHAFVRPGRTRDFVRHVGCATAELARALMAVHGSVERMPVDASMDADAASEARATLCAVAAT